MNFSIGMYLFALILTNLVSLQCACVSVGLYEFLYVFMPESESDALAKIAGNLLTSLPNDDDLELTFRNDRRAHLASR